MQMVGLDINYPSQSEVCFCASMCKKGLMKQQKERYLQNWNNAEQCGIFTKSTQLIYSNSIQEHLCAHM